VKDRGILKTELDNLYERYDRRDYVDPDPLVFLYRYDRPADREIAGFIASSLAFGGVGQIMRSVGTVLERMGDSPYRFLMDTDKNEISRTFGGFRHRWASGDDMTGTLAGIKKVIKKYGSLEKCFLDGFGDNDEDIMPALSFLVSKIDRSGRCEGSNCLLPSPE